MSDSSFSDSSDLDDIAEYEIIMEINNEDQDEVEAVRMRRYINRERDVAEERLMADYCRIPEKEERDERVLEKEKDLE
ncbi:hypothetical protein Tco_0224710 [Tanacetum coccineum]